MNENNITKRSVAIKDCIAKATSNIDFDLSLEELDKKINRLSYRLNLVKKLLEQLFSNMGFSINENVSKDELLEKFYQENNQYKGRFD